MSEAPPPRVRLEAALRAVYGPAADSLIEDLVSDLPAAEAAPRPPLPGRDQACWIGYADSLVGGEGRSPLETLRGSFTRHGLGEAFPVVHLLPFYPWDTDRGFSVEDYYAVAPENGRWGDVEALAGDGLALMFDFVANHASIANPLVQSALIARHLDPDDPRRTAHARYQDFVLAFAEDAPEPDQLAALARPRAAPVLTPYCLLEHPDERLEALPGHRQDPEVDQRLAAGSQVRGEGLVWTTFSRGPDAAGREQTRQVDLDYRNPAVFREAAKILCFYRDRGAALLRLDAIGYLWKRLGSTSLHEPETHQLLVALKAYLELAAPEVQTVAEVNEDQERVLGYLGEDAAPESDLVYQFTHFPLAVHAVHTGQAGPYRDWLATLAPFRGRQFVTALGSHDGMGMKPLRGRLPEDELEAFAARLAEDHGGLPNHAVLPGGRRIVYEVCATPWDLINAPGQPHALERYRAVAALGLLPRGLPGFYVNGVFGLGGHHPEEGLDENRTVNRQRLDAAWLDGQLADPASRPARVLAMLRHLLARRAALPAFDPDAPALEPLDLGAGLVAARVPACDPEHDLVALVDVAGAGRSLDPSALAAALPGEGPLVDHLDEAEVPAGTLEVPPYGVLWVGRRPARGHTVVEREDHP